MPLVGIFLPEGCLAHIIQHHEGPINIDELFTKGERLHDVFRMEHFHDFERDRVKEKMCFFVDDGILKLTNGGTIVEVTSNESAKVLEFFVQLTEGLLDTYLIVLLSVEQLCGRPMVIPFKELVTEMHASMKDLHHEDVIPHLHSCLTEVIRTSFSRFEQLKFIEMRTYPDKKGTPTIFVQSPAHKQADIRELITFLQSLRTYTTEQFKFIDDEVADALYRTHGPVQVAKL